MPTDVLPRPTPELASKRKKLAPAIHEAFTSFSADGALPAKTKQLIAVAVAHVTQCPYCIRGHTKGALRHGATPEELMEAIWVGWVSPPSRYAAGSNRKAACRGRYRPGGTPRKASAART